MTQNGSRPENATRSRTKRRGEDEEWEGTGVAVGMLLAFEVASDPYGRHLHRHVIRLGRGEDSPRLFVGVIALTKRALFSRLRWIHRSLTVITILVLLVHVVTAFGD
ncbi:MAG: hypothetical protein V5A43_06130 [Haloarculaceae archaeon]